MIIKGLKEIFLFLAIVNLLLSGCNRFSKRLSMLNIQTRNEKKSNLQISKNILDSINEKNLETLKALLCKKTQRITGIDQQILEGFDLFDGRVVSFDDYLGGHEGSSIEHGKITLLKRSWRIKEIITDKGGKYEIFIHVYIICENDKEREGISQIDIARKSDDTKSIIGYGWPIYYNAGRDMSLKVIKVLSESDFNGFKLLFCENTLNIENIEDQIQTGIDFFEGKAILGRISKGNIVYDGSLDYKTFVVDNEVVIGNKPVRTSISVFNENIITDTGKTYKIEYNAYLLFKGEERYKGISHIRIIDNYGNECIIGKKID